MRSSAAAAPLISLPEIAELAQVRRPVVTTWRRRYPDFPAPAGGDAARPLFDVALVTEWLRGRGLGNSDAAVLQAEPVLHTLAARTDRFGPNELIALVTSLLCLRHLDDDAVLVPERTSDGASASGPAEQAAWARIAERAAVADAEDEYLLAEITGAGPDALELAKLADDLAEAAYGTRGAFEWLLAARSRLGLATLTTDAVVPPLAGLMAAIADAAGRARDDAQLTIADPAAGAGDLLCAVADVQREAGSESGAVFVAAEPNPYLARLARRRLLVHGVAEYEFAVTVGTDLTEDMGDPDLVVTRLPYQASEERDAVDALRRIEQTADLLGPGRTAVILGPASALVGPLPKYGAADRLRTELLAAGIVEAVVRLPGGMMPFRPGHHTALWVLTRDPVKQARGRVLVCDVAARELTERLCATLAEDILLWRAEGHRQDGHEPRYGAAVLVADLARRPGTALDPPRRTSAYQHLRTAPEQVSQILEAEGRLDALAARAAAAYVPLHTGAQRRTGSRPARTTVGALIADRRVVQLPGSRISPEDIAPDGHHAVLGTPEALGHGRPGARRIDRAVLAAKYEHVRLTEPGDLVVTTAPRLGVVVDDQGFSVVDFPARVLRLRASEEKPTPTPHVLAALLLAARDTSRAPGAVRAARHVKDIDLPDLSDAEIRHFDAVLRAIHTRRSLLHGQLDALEEMYRLVSLGLSDGTLTIDPTAAPNTTP